MHVVAHIFVCFFYSVTFFCNRALEEGLYATMVGSPGAGGFSLSFSYPLDDGGAPWSMSYPSWESFSYPDSSGEFSMSFSNPGFSYPPGFSFVDYEDNNNGVVEGIHEKGSSSSDGNGDAASSSENGGTNGSHNNNDKNTSPNDLAETTSNAETDSGSSSIEKASGAGNNQGGMTTGSIVAVVLGAMALILVGVVMTMRRLRSLSSSSGMSAMWSNSSWSNSSVDASSAEGATPV